MTASQRVEVTTTVPSPAGPVLAPVVKVCGMTRVDDAVLAARLGAGAVGVVFWPGSPRAVTIETARAIARAVPPFVAVVGVFVNQPAQQILEVAAAVPLSVVQFHGDESDDLVSAFPWRVIRAVALEAPDGPTRLARLPQMMTVLLDAHDRQRRGGTGRPINWSGAAAVASARRVLLAGGLRADNVGEALRVVRPWGVDVSSGVESSPGVKDHAKLQEFFDAIRSAAPSAQVSTGKSR